MAIIYNQPPISIVEVFDEGQLNSASPNNASDKSDYKYTDEDHLKDTQLFWQGFLIDQEANVYEYTDEDYTSDSQPFWQSFALDQENK